MAYEESSFRQDVIDGSVASSAGAQGILQLEPASFPSLRLTPPYSTQDTLDQIQAAGQYLMTLYGEFNDWSQAVGAYNAGPGTMSNALSTGAALPQETVNYVSQIFADVPVAPVDLPA
jgi:soluble lytic murein transglycosylase-like protein